jgi:hypothetical protein
MAGIIYKSLSSLSPIELKYEYFRNESLQSTVETTKEGLTLYKIDGLNNYKDVAINKDSCFVLTSAINLNTVFTNEKQLTIGGVPASIQFAARITEGLVPIYFAKYSEATNTIRQTLSAASTFYLQPVEGMYNTVEMFIQNRYVQVDEQYPYTVRTADRSLDPESLHRQRFEVVYQNKLITFKTLTNSGYRYLSFNNDNILRATGLMFNFILNDNMLNDYIFNCVPVTDETLNYGFKPANSWVTYYFDIESGQDNTNLRVNKNITPIQTNLLLDFPLEAAAKFSSVNTNIANLKTSMTPTGGPAPIDNSYKKEIITTN